MGSVLFSILTDAEARTSKGVEAQLEKKLVAGSPWFGKENDLVHNP